MAVKQLEPGFVRVEPDVLDWTDVLMDAKALIEEHGWVKNTSGDYSTGFSLHGAIGTVTAKLTGEGKDQPVARTLRQDANAKLLEVMPDSYKEQAQPDIAWNDKQRGKKSVMALIDKALARA